MLISTAPSGDVGGTRLPSNRMSVRWYPMLRRFSTLAEGFGAVGPEERLPLPAFVDWPRDASKMGRSFNWFPSVPGCNSDKSSTATDVRGVGLLSPLRMSREPVTVISSSLADSVAAAAGG